MTKSPRELAARALCRKAGHPENTMFEGKPMWMSFLDEVDAVLEAIRELDRPTATVVSVSWTLSAEQVSRLYTQAIDVISCNRAGPRERELTLGEIVARYGSH